jgi:hypothetical protein
VQIGSVWKDGKREKEFLRVRGKMESGDSYSDTFVVVVGGGEVRSRAVLFKMFV